MTRRYTIAAAILIMTVSLSFSQSPYLPVNSQNKCEVSEVVTAEGLAQSALFVNELAWTKALTHDQGTLNKAVKDSVGGKITGEYEFPVYSQNGIFKKMSGTISYEFFVESKDGKYRFEFSHFVYHYFKADRNSKMVRTGQTKPLEETDASGWQKLWTEHRKTVSKLVTDQVAALKTKMVEVPTTTPTKTGEKKVEW